MGGHWTRVPVPVKLTGYVRSAVAFGGASASDFWLFDSYRANHALRFTGGTWTLQQIPAWVLPQRYGGGGLSAVTTSVFGPDNVWVFGLDAGAYAAHYNGRTWAKVRLPSVPDAVSAVSPTTSGPCTGTRPGTGTARRGPRPRSRRRPATRPRRSGT